MDVELDEEHDAQQRHNEKPKENGDKLDQSCKNHTIDRKRSKTSVDSRLEDRVDYISDHPVLRRWSLLPGNLSRAKQRSQTWEVLGWVLAAVSHLDSDD
jgi:hypothetical protein